MKIIVVCISLALVACTRGQIKTYIDDYSRFFDVGTGRWLRSAARGVGNEITEAFYMPASSGGNQGGSNFQDLGAGSLSNQVDNGAADSNYFQGWGANAGGVSNQGGSGGDFISNFQGWDAGAGGFSNQGSSGATDGSNFQGWTLSNQGGTGDGSSSKFQAFTTGSVSNQGGSGGVGAGNFQGNSANTDSANSQGDNEGAFGSNFQSWDAGAGGVSNQGGSGRGDMSHPGPIGNAGGGSFQGNNANTGSASSQGDNESAFGSNFQRNAVGSGRGDLSLPGRIGNAGGSQGFSRGPVSSINRGGSRGAGGFSTQGDSGLGEYQNVPIGSQTSEGRNIDPELLEQVRLILLQEEASFGSGGGASPSSSSFRTPSSANGALSTGFGMPSFANRAPSTSYGAPSSAHGAPSAGSGGGRSGRGHVVGIVLEGIDQSIQVAQYHQKTSELVPSRGGSPRITSPIPSRSFGSPH